MNTSKVHHPNQTFSISYHSIRNITSPEDLDNSRKVYVGQTEAKNIIGLPTDENVRDYMLEAEGKKRRRPTQVHKAIEDTIRNNPQNFSALNSGIVIVARRCEIDEKEKKVLLHKPSIINGSQTQGVIKDFYDSLKSEKFEAEHFPFHIKFEIIVTDDEDLIAEISIARNFQNDVMTISIAGRLGQLDELEKYLQVKKPGSQLQKSETKLSEDYIKTERLLQVIAALAPEELWLKPGEMNKVYTYSMKTKCLKDFQEIFEKAKDPKAIDHSRYLELYQFYLDIASQAQDLYEKWKTHQGFSGTKLRSIKRDEGNNIEEVPDGIIFPILASLSAFARKTKKGWIIEAPKQFNEAELIQAAKSVYMEIAFHNPWNMGKSKACYSALYQITSIYKKLFATQS